MRRMRHLVSYVFSFQTVKNLIGDIKKLLESRTVPYFRETL